MAVIYFGDEYISTRSEWNPLKKDTWGPLSLSLPRDGYGGGTAHPVESALMIKYELHIRMYYFQPQKYLPKNQGSRPAGQKENSDSPKSWRGPGHSAGAGHDGVLDHDVFPAGNHAAALLHAKVIPCLALASHPLLQLSSSALLFWLFLLKFYNCWFGQHKPNSALPCPREN